MARTLLTVSLALLFLAHGAYADGKPRWIVVTAPSFEEAVEPLVERRREQGFDVVPLAMAALETPVRLRAELLRLAAESKGETYVLLVGVMKATGEDADPGSVLPAFLGTIESMKGLPTDNAYGCLDRDLLPDIAVGRFPARTVDDVRAMIDKTIDFEEQSAPADWRHRLTLLVGHPGGRSPTERQLASYVVKNAVGTRFDQVHPQWSTRAIVHMDQSPFCVPAGQIQERSLGLLEEGQLLSIYLGHCGAEGFYSDGERFLRKKDWAEHAFGPAMGIHLSCGCYTCQIEGWGGEGFAHAGMRSAQGPVAVIGAHAASHGAMGKLAFEGLLPILAAKEPPHRLGAWWLAMKGGIAKGRISRLTFFLYDRADGSGGKVPLKRQRLEHLEMWTLLGDPALRIPLEPLDIDLQVDGILTPGTRIRVRGALPPSLATGDVPVRVSVERAFGTVPPELPPLPTEPGEARDRAMRERHALTNDVTIRTSDVTANAGRFEVSLELPAVIPGSRLIIRARAGEAEGSARGAVAVPLVR